MIDYYESAEDLTITRERALLELARHNCEDIEQFFEDQCLDRMYVVRTLPYKLDFCSLGEQVRR